MKIDKCKKLICNLQNKKICCINKVIKTSIKSWIKIKKRFTELLNLIKKYG